VTGASVPSARSFSITSVWLRALSALTLALSMVAVAGSARAEFDIDKVKDSVVRIFVRKTHDGKTGRWSGTGFVINDQGYVATNYHVVEGAEKIEVPDGSWDKILTAEVVWSSANVDLALIRVKALHRPPVRLAVPEPKRGSAVWAVGFPGPGDTMARRAEGHPSLVATVTSGVVGKIFIGGHSDDPRTFRRMIQHSAEVNGGNSGGPLFNACHEVIGIHTYGKRTILEVIKDKRTGKSIAVGRTSHGIFNGSHVSVLIKNLKAQHIAYTPATEVCVAAAPGAGLPVMIYVYIAAATLLGGTGIALALRRPRERIVKVVETYSQMVRRKRSEMAVRDHERPRVSKRPVSANAETAVPGWRFEGYDSDGHSIEFVVKEAELARSPDGFVLGRQEALVNYVITDRSVSRRHARLMAVGEEIGIVDLDSTHGTWVSGRKLPANASPAVIEPGSRVALGGVSFKVTRQ
jgi:Trypsin-like peptidase domain/FHA domain